MISLLCELSRALKLIKTESGMVATRGWAEEEIKLFSGYKFQFCKMKRLWIGYTTVNMLNTELYTSRWLQW